MSGILSVFSSLLAAVSFRISGNVAPYQLPSLPSLPSYVTTNSIVSYLASLNPFILIILGGIVFFAGKLAKFIGIVIVIIGVAEFLLPYLSKVV